MAMKKSGVVTLAAVCLIIGLTVFLGSCSRNNLDISLAPIHEVEISIAESYPPQVFVYIKGGLSDGCTAFHDLETTRNGDTIDIKVTVQREKNRECTAIYGYFEKNVALGTDFIVGKTYTVNVNSETRTFSVQ